MPSSLVPLTGVGSLTRCNLTASMATTGCICNVPRSSAASVRSGRGDRLSIGDARPCCCCCCGVGEIAEQTGTAVSIAVSPAGLSRSGDCSVVLRSISCRFGRGHVSRTGLSP